MFSWSFRGGVHPEPHKAETAAKPILPGPNPARVVLPLRQHIGQACTPVVRVGERVRIGQVVADCAAAVSAPIHASIAGTVVELGDAVTVESDYSENRCEYSGNSRDLDRLKSEQIRHIARAAGIVGLGGAAFPTAVKLTPPPDRPVDTLILNGCECEPYLTADHRLMLEQSSDIVFGLYAMAKAVRACRAVIAVEDNKPDAAAALARALREAVLHPFASLSPKFTAEVRKLPTKYPQGAEKQLVKAVTGRVVPSGCFPVQVGVLVHNVGTAAALAEAIISGKPLVERVVTVAGPIIRKPGNYLVRLGTLVKDVLAHAGGVTEPIGKLILGGPMMGVAQTTADVPVTKGTSGIVVFGQADAVPMQPGPCIRCARCSEVCPALLQPMFLSRLAEKGFWQEAAEAGALNCMECGSCAYTCPAKRPLVQLIRVSKAQIIKGGMSSGTSLRHHTVTTHA